MPVRRATRRVLHQPVTLQSVKNPLPLSPKDGKRSVGVQRQYCGTLGKKENCQVAVSLHYVGTRGHFPLTMRLYLPEPWIGDEARLDQAGVPLGSRRMISKGQIALDLLDQVRGEGLPGQVLISDAGYGVAREFRDGLASQASTSWSA
jgi:SRSO17 transposase